MKGRLFFVLASVILGAALIASYYRSFDELDRVAWTTQSLTEEYERTNDPSSLIAWTTTQHGAGGDMTMSSKLLAWAYEHPAQFERFIDSVPTEMLADLASNLAYEDYPARSGSRFRQVFGGSSSKGVQAVFKSGEELAAH